MMGTALQDLGERASLPSSGSIGHIGWRPLLTQVHSNSAPVSEGMQLHYLGYKSRLCQLRTCILRRTSLPLMLHSWLA